MNARDEILSALRRGRGALHSEIGTVGGCEVFSDFPENGDLLKNFIKRLEILKGECYVTASEHEAGEKIEKLVRDAHYSRILIQDHPLVQSVVKENAFLAEISSMGEVANLERTASPAFADFEVGVTSADLLIARTGSVVLRSTTAGGRRLSVLPEFHIVVARVSQLVPSLEDWFRTLHSELPKDPLWSYGAIITGPSRTADIEKILVLGAHGPKRLAVVVVTS